MLARTFLHALAALLVVLAWRPVCGETAATGAPGLVVLRNGQVLAGRPTLLGDKYVVELAGSSEVRLPSADVEFVCRDLLEAYQIKCQALAPQNATAQLDLADWCVRQNLYAQAAEQLVEVMAYAPTNKRLAEIEARLRASVHQAEAAPTSTPVAAGPTTEQLEQTMRGLAPATLERFVDTVQPLLLNRCAASGCHGSSATSTFKLLRPGAGAALTRRSTQLNLFAILPHIDRTAPDKSPLLTLPSAPHGTAKSAIFAEREQRLHDELAEWIRRVAQPDAFPSTSEVQPATATADPAASKRATMKALFERYQSHASDADFNRQAKREALADPKAKPASSATPGEKRASPATPKLLPPTGGTPGSAPVPEKPAAPRAEPTTDPVDPEVFNRQFSGNSSAPSEPAKK